MHKMPYLCIHATAILGMSMIAINFGMTLEELANAVLLHSVTA